MPTIGYDALVLAGGAARRLGGADKPGLTVGAATLLDRVLAAVPDARRTVVVGPPRPTARPVRWAREEPAGGGPVAALAAGLPQVTAPVVLLLATDLPFLGAATVRALLAGLGAGDDEDGADGGDGGEHRGHGAAGGTAPDAAVLVDAGGRDQPLLGAYRTAPLRAAVAACGPEPAGLPLRRVLAALDVRRLPDAHGAAFDCDTWADVERARARARSSDTGGPAV